MNAQTVSFEYKGIAEGKYTEGVVEALDKDEASFKLREKKVIITSINIVKNQKIKMLLQIHDELIFEVPKIEVKRISKIITEEMSGVVDSDQHSFSIPLTVDLNSGDNWGTLH